MTFAGFGGHPVKGWFTIPAEVSAPVPAVLDTAAAPPCAARSHSVGTPRSSKRRSRTSDSPPLTRADEAPLPTVGPIRRTGPDVRAPPRAVRP
ncbi:hypothetical protein [Streptomyces sp. NPDC102476]|uniref:hypothetical protein n=1 Tax=Streptomyces sp. NPDC102476 TaxID=3366181 RepID=UPI003824CFC6